MMSTTTSNNVGWALGHEAVSLTPTFILVPESWNDRRADPVSDIVVDEKTDSKIKAHVKHNRVIKDSGLASSRTADEREKPDSVISAPQEDLYAHELHHHDSKQALSDEHHDHDTHNLHDSHEDHHDHDTHNLHDSHEEHHDHDTHNLHDSHEEHHQLSIRDVPEHDANLGSKDPPNHIPSGDSKIEPHVIAQREIERGHLHLLSKDGDKHIKMREDLIESHRRKNALDKEDLTPRRDDATKRYKRCELT